jgi:hypothetical protein
MVSFVMCALYHAREELSENFHKFLGKSGALEYTRAAGKAQVYKFRTR